MIEVEVYARGLRSEENLLQLRQQMDLLPKVRYKIDSAHDIVYFEMDDPAHASQQQLDDVFVAIGLSPRFVGELPKDLKRGDQTSRLE
jgi:hypothetical protein